MSWCQPVLMGSHALAVEIRQPALCGFAQQRSVVQANHLNLAQADTEDVAVMLDDACAMGMIVDVGHCSLPAGWRGVSGELAYRCLRGEALPVMKSAARSAIIMISALVGPRMMRGMAEPSTTRNALTPRTRI